MLGNVSSQLNSLGGVPILDSKKIGGSSQTTLTNIAKVVAWASRIRTNMADKGKAVETRYEDCSQALFHAAS